MKRSDKTLDDRRLRARAKADPFFLGSALAAYKMAHGLNDSELAEWLDCSVRNVDRLTLCRLPNCDERLTREVEQIAEFADCNADRLLVSLREVAVLNALRKEGQRARESFLMAARDRKEESTEHDSDERP